MIAEATKTCTKCGQAKPLSAFGRVREDREWRKPKCRECAAEIERQRRKGGQR